MGIAEQIEVTYLSNVAGNTAYVFLPKKHIVARKNYLQKIYKVYV